MSISRGKALKKRAMPRVKVMVPEWADEETPASEAYVWVLSLSTKQREAWEKSITSSKGKDVKINMDNMRSRAAVLSCVDDEGQKIFNDGDIAELNEQPGGALGAIFDAFMSVNRFSKEDVEELAGESAPVQS